MQRMNTTDSILCILNRERGHLKVNEVEIMGYFTEIPFQLTQDVFSRQRKHMNKCRKAVNY